jgi:hypothetical protein
MGVKVPSTFWKVKINVLLSNTCRISQSRYIEVFSLSIVREPSTNYYKPQCTMKYIDPDPIVNKTEWMGIHRLEGGN